MAIRKKKILVADDDEDILDVISIILEGEGYNVTTISRGEEVLEIKEDFPDLFLLDISMAGIDGRDICRYLKNQSSTKHIPVILFSANKEIEKIAFEVRADDFICKPFDIDVLLQKALKYS